MLRKLFYFSYRNSVLVSTALVWHPDLGKPEHRRRNFHSEALHCPARHIGQTHNPCNANTHGCEGLCIPTNTHISQVYLIPTHKYTHAFVHSATHTNYALRYPLSSESDLILEGTHPHTHTCTHYSLLEDTRSDHSMTGSERTSRITESTTHFISVQLLQQSSCAACRIKPWI